MPRNPGRNRNVNETHRRSPISGGAKGGPGKDGTKNKPYTSKKNTGGYGSGEGPDPKGTTRKPR